MKKARNLNYGIFRAFTSHDALQRRTLKGKTLPLLGKGLGNTMVVRGLISGLILAVFVTGPLLATDLETDAREAVENERYEEARDLYIQLSEQSSWNVDYLLWVATLSDWLKDSVTATQFYDRALAREPLNVEALVGKAYSLMRQQDFQTALEPLSMARLVAPNNADVLLALARAHYYQGDTPRRPWGTSIRCSTSIPETRKLSNSRPFSLGLALSRSASDTGTIGIQPYLPARWDH